MGRKGVECRLVSFWEANRELSLLLNITVGPLLANGEWFGLTVDYLRTEYSSHFDAILLWLNCSRMHHTVFYFLPANGIKVCSDCCQFSLCWEANNLVEIIYHDIQDSLSLSKKCFFTAPKLMSQTAIGFQKSRRAFNMWIIERYCAFPKRCVLCGVASKVINN